MINAVILYGLVAGAAAMPRPGDAGQKRDVVWETQWREVVETVWSTQTIYNDPSEATAVSAAGYSDPNKDAVVSAAGFDNDHEASPSYSRFRFQPKASSTPTSLSVADAAPSEDAVPAPAKKRPAKASRPAETPTVVDVTPASVTKAKETPKTTKQTTLTKSYAPPASSAPPKVSVAPAAPSASADPVAPVATSSVSSVDATSNTSGSSSGSSGSSSGSDSGSSPSSSFTGEGTFYTPGLGSCGTSSTDADMIVAVGVGFMTSSYNGNPNMNPNCGKSINIWYGGKTASATIVDTCAGCKGPHDLDMSPSLFDKFAAQSVGRITDVKWAFAD